MWESVMFFFNYSTIYHHHKEMQSLTPWPYKSYAYVGQTENYSKTNRQAALQPCSSYSIVGESQKKIASKLNIILL